MTSIIKNQIIKHLSKFVRNITADQISVQVLSGKGELKNIELNEIVLSEVLEFPTWLRIKRAVCSRISVKVPWTRLKTLPVQLFIDELHVEVVLSSEELVESGLNLGSALGESSYGFANRVAEGLSLYVGSIDIQFDSGVFRGSLSLSRIAVESTSPGWQPINDLRHSRIVDQASSKMLMFKLISWNLLRIQASVQSDMSQRGAINAPLRLITSSGKCRITVKKLITDGSVLGGRIQIILDNILWIATLPQLRSAIAFYDHIMGFVRSSPRKLPAALSTQQHEMKLPLANKSPNAVSNAFRNFDFAQTSYHVYVGKIDLHLCDDSQSEEGFPFDWDIPCGALQVTLMQISVDVYPANCAISDRSDWVRYDSENQCAAWAHKLLQLHLRNVCSTLDENAQTRLIRAWPQLMSQSCVIRMQDVLVQCVTDIASKKDALFNLFMSDSKSKASLSNQPLVHLEFTSFYHPATDSFLLPPSITHLSLGPFFFLFDQRTIRWVLYVASELKQALDASEASFDLENMPKTCLRIDLLMPKIILPLQTDVFDHRFPRRIVLSMSTVLGTNCAAFDDQTVSFFKSISPGAFNLIDDIELAADSSGVKEFILHLNQLNDTASSKCERFWISTSPIWIDTDMGEGTASTPIVSDVVLHALAAVNSMQVNVAVQPVWRVRAALNHYQFLQITRLINSLSLFVDQLTADQKFFAKNMANGNGVTVHLSFFVEQVDLSIVLPIGPVPTPYDLANTVARSQTPFSESTDEDVGSAPTLLPTAYGPQTSEEKHPAKQPEFESFPSFPNQLDNETGSVNDETMSVITNISEEEQLVVFDATEDDIFQNDVAVAVEAFAIDEEIGTTKKKENKDFAKEVSVLTVVLDDLNAVCSFYNGVGRATGYVTNVGVQQTLGRACGDLYASMNDRTSRVKSENDQRSKKEGDCEGEPVARFRFHSSADGRNPSLEVQIHDLKVALDDSLVGQLSAFVYDAEKADLPLHLKVNVSESLFTIKDPKVKPLRIRIKECIIEQGDEDESM